MMKIAKKYLFVIVILFFALSVLPIAQMRASAAELTAAPETVDETDLTEGDSPITESGENRELDGLVEGFLAKLRAKYGDGYEAYLDVILSEWGTVEDYLLSLAGERDDPAANGWRAFIGGLTETAPIWATALAFIIAVTGLLYKRFKDKQILSTVKSFKNTTYKGLNKMQELLLALGKAQLKQLGCGAATEAERKALEDSMKKLGEVDKDEGV